MIGLNKIGYAATMQLSLADYKFNFRSWLAMRSAEKIAQPWLLLALICSSFPLNADAPTGADLVNACEDAERHGYDSTRGMLCIWYVTPCDCNFGKNSEVPRVCLPADVTHEVLAMRVVAGLKKKVELQALSAELAAGRILAPAFPCED